MTGRCGLQEGAVVVANAGTSRAKEDGCRERRLGREKNRKVSESAREGDSRP